MEIQSNIHILIQFPMFLKMGFKVSHRTVQGIIRGLSDYIRVDGIHYTDEEMNFKG